MKKLSGFRDLEFDIFFNLFQKIKPIIKKYGFRFLDFPVLENSSLFLRSLSESTDIISKELFSFTDKDNQNVCLRPEITAQVMRYMLNNGKLRDRISYFSPCFRRESPQIGRYRQFYQIGFELLGNDSYLADIDCLQLSVDILKKLKIDYVIELNSIGTIEERKKYIEDLQLFFKDKNLSENSRLKLKNNPLLILDSKEDTFKNIPNIIDYLSDNSKNNYNLIKNYLIKNKIKFIENNKLVRGLDYYSHLVFEIKNNGITIGGGGRYDGLLGQISKNTINTPAVGFALGIDRIINIFKEKKTPTAIILFKETIDYRKIQELRKKYKNYSMDFLKTKKIELKKFLNYNLILIVEKENIKIIENFNLIY